MYYFLDPPRGLENNGLVCVCVRGGMPEEHLALLLLALDLH